MPQVIIKIGQSPANQHIYTLNDEQIQYLLKFVNSISDETEKETHLLKEIEIGLKEVKKIQKGEISRKTIKQMVNGK
jgi:hypothetical protein